MPRGPARHKRFDDAPAFARVRLVGAFGAPCGMSCRWRLWCNAPASPSPRKYRWQRRRRRAGRRSGRNRVALASPPVASKNLLAQVPIIQFLCFDLHAGVVPLDRKVAGLVFSIITSHHRLVIDPELNVRA